jgi:hypothetical protein
MRRVVNHYLTAGVFIIRSKAVIVIDGQNTACQYGEDMYYKTNYFVAHGITLVVDYFRVLGHDQILAVVPESFKSSGRSRDGTDELKKLFDSGNLLWTPSHKKGEGVKDSYDDHYIVGYAKMTKGVIVSGDQFRDILARSDTGPELRRTIERRRIAPRFPRGALMFDEIPYPGISLEKLLVVQ